MGTETVNINQELEFHVSVDVRPEYSKDCLIEVPSRELATKWLRGSLETRHTDGRLHNCLGFFSSSLAQLQTAMAVVIASVLTSSYLDQYSLELETCNNQRKYQT